MLTQPAGNHIAWTTGLVGGQRQKIGKLDDSAAIEVTIIPTAQHSKLGRQCLSLVEWNFFLKMLHSQRHDTKQISESLQATKTQQTKNRWFRAAFLIACHSNTIEFAAVQNKTPNPKEW